MLSKATTKYIPTRCLNIMNSQNEKKTRTTQKPANANFNKQKKRRTNRELISDTMLDMEHHKQATEMLWKKCAKCCIDMVQHEVIFTTRASERNEKGVKNL